MVRGETELPGARVMAWVTGGNFTGVLNRNISAKHRTDRTEVASSKELPQIEVSKNDHHKVASHITAISITGHGTEQYMLHALVDHIFARYDRIRNEAEHVKLT